MTIDVRKTILDAIVEQSAQQNELNFDRIIEALRQRPEMRSDGAMQQAVLAHWQQLISGGYIAWGASFAAPCAPACHLTEHGQRTLKNLSRDPSNPEGYMNFLRASATFGPIAESYVNEALHTYGANCYKATAVMIGAATERLVLDLRDALVIKLTALHKSVPAALQDWRIKTVFDAIADRIESEIQANKKAMPLELHDSFIYHWPSFFQQIRSGRNESGHPTSISPVTPETVHASMLIFPELAKVADRLKQWVDTHSW